MHTAHPHSSEELANDFVRVVVEKQPACRVEFQVSIYQPLIQKAQLEAVKAVNKEVTVPGFRKGKAPDAMIAKKFPYDILRKRHKILADMAFVEAQKLVKIPVLNNQSPVTFDVKKEEEDAMEFSYSFETEPATPSVDPSLFHPTPVQKKEVGEKEINEAIRQMAFFYAKWETVQDRPVQEGDFVIIDLDTIEENGDVARVFSEVRFEVKPERMADWMRLLILNAKMGDVLEGLSEPDAAAPEKEKAEFRPKKVRLTLLKVEKAEVPSVDDEFAQKVGSKDVAAMREFVEGVLKRQVEEKAESDLREQVNQFLVKQYAFDLPSSLIDAEVKHRSSQAMQNPDYRKEWELASLEKQQSVTERVAEEAKQSLSLFYLSKQIVQDAKISITHQEVERQAVMQRKANPLGMQSGGQISREEFALALSIVFLTKAQDFILNSQKT